jgi:hypothetical protein
MTSVFLFWEKPSRSWRGSNEDPSDFRLFAEVRQTRRLKLTRIQRLSGTGSGVKTGQRPKSIGHDPRKFLGLLYPAANGASARDQAHLVFLVVVRFKGCVQMIRSALSKFENGINPG